MKKFIFFKSISLMVIAALTFVFCSCDNTFNSEDLGITRSSDVFLTVSSSYSYQGNNRSGINFDIYGTNLTGSSVNVGILDISVYYLDTENNRFVKVYQINQLDNGVIQSSSSNVDLRLGGSLNGNLFLFWDDRFDYYLEVKSDKSILGSNIVLVN